MVLNVLKIKEFVNSIILIALKGVRFTVGIILDLMTCVIVDVALSKATC